MVAKDFLLEIGFLKKDWISPFFLENAIISDYIAIK
jgi:hypothetical protein